MEDFTSGLPMLNQKMKGEQPSTKNLARYKPSSATAMTEMENVQGNRNREPAGSAYI